MHVVYMTVVVKTKFSSALFRVWSHQMTIKTEIVNPNVSNFIKSLRDIGYTFEIAVADILDNSITANASYIEIYAIPKPQIKFEILDNGTGMAEPDLIEAMRLASKDPNDERNKRDLGRFGLGLKTASFSQCVKVTVITKKITPYLLGNGIWITFKKQIGGS